jgi:hypothetical protein
MRTPAENSSLARMLNRFAATLLGLFTSCECLERRRVAEGHQNHGVFEFTELGTSLPREGDCSDIRRIAYRLARLAVKYGSEILLDDLLLRLSADCPWRDDPQGSGCGAHFADLPPRRPPDMPVRKRLRVISGGTHQRPLRIATSSCLRTHEPRYFLPTSSLFQLICNLEVAPGAHHKILAAGTQEGAEQPCRRVRGGLYALVVVVERFPIH